MVVVRCLAGLDVELFDQRLAGLIVNIDKHHPRALKVKGSGKRGANAAAAAGNKDHTLFKACIAR